MIAPYILEVVPESSLMGKLFLRATAISFNSSVIAETQVNEVFEKKGHEFVDVDVNLFKQEDKSCIMTINLLSIYKVRGSSN